ncbi:MAG: DNA mismatch repair protein MutS [Deltaproteobacteria bacterium]|nr:DNA mismatch repair protein MutS [Deltaproteobacteria bacterium]
MTGIESTVNLTPMLRQYLEIKEQHKDAILFYRIGDFYEMFFDDAVKASKVLDIVLTTRNKNDPNPVPLCGIPHHAMQPYLDKLVEKGFKVAICDQVEDPKSAKGVVKREVTRVVTPGLEAYLVSLFQGKESWGVALLEVTTGNFRVTEIPLDREALLEELNRSAPSEILLSEKWKWQDDLKLPSHYCTTFLPEWIWEEGTARRLLYDQFGVSTLSGFDCEGIPAGVIAAGAALHYVRETQKVGRLSHLTSLKRYSNSEAMFLGEESRMNLNLNELIDFMNCTKTAMGQRRLKGWLAAPLLEKKKIEERLDAVGELVQHRALTESLRHNLDKVYDLERINSRLSLGNANPRDLRALAGSLQVLGQIKPLLSELNTFALKKIASTWESFETLEQEIEKTLVDDPPVLLTQGGMIREGVSQDLDALKSLRHDAKSSIAAIEERERQRTGIGSLKVHYNRVFGYYLEVSAANLAKVPSDYIRKQTLTNAERFITPELKEFEDKVLGADEKIKFLEQEIFNGLREKAKNFVPSLQYQAGRVADLDVFQSLATYARDEKTVRPLIEESGVLEIHEGRHPLVERNLPAGSFVANDLSMDVQGARLLMITGPNMAGKSTVIRQTGVIVLMAQAGSFVPAASARIGIVDRLYTRVGASDRLARGESTFMVEMCETAAILHHATDKSLVLLDEIGRGTSTFDGISIAWAVAEYLHDKIRARTLFATHYHELIDLALTRSGIRNYNVKIQEQKGEIVFLYRLVPGGMSHSYGLHVGKLAGLPVEVLDRAKEVLKNLERNEKQLKLL